MKGFRQWNRHHDEVCVKINGEMHYLWRAAKQEVGRWANNRVESCHLSFRRRERAMLRFRQMKSLQKFASVHANVRNHFNLQRHLADRQIYKNSRSAAPAEWLFLWP